MTLIIFGMVLPWLLVGAGCWLVYQFIRQYGQILLRLESLEAKLSQFAPSVPQLAPPAPSLALGSAAPEFELPDLAGGRQSLAQLRGRKVLLIFFNPGCGYCVKMVPDLGALPVDGKDDHPLPVVVATGPAEAVRKLIEEHRMRCPVLLQEQTGIAERYQAQGTPTGYLIDEQGRIASGMALGAAALLALAEPQSMASNGNTGADAAAGKGKTNRGLAASRIKRDGLKAGTRAPAFRLPLLEGGELALADYRGRRVLLVFSDPECGPCDQIAPQVEQWHRQHPTVQVILVSRRDVDANRKKASQHGLTFPVVLQESWEISKLYGMFATPIAYLIDEQGVTAADVAVGVEPIQALLAVAAPEHSTTLTKGATP